MMRSDSKIREGLGSVLSRLLGLARWTEELDYRRHTGFRRVLARQLQVLLIASKGMREDEVRLRAASLSLITLLSVVPFLAVVFWVFQAFGGVEDLRSKVEPFIYENLAVGAQDEAMAWINRFIDQVHAGAVGGVGTGILVVAAIGLLGSMEQTFNRVWGVSRGRPLLNRFVVYWCVLTVGPILLAASLAGTAAVTGWVPIKGAATAAALGLAPMVITVGAFTLFYTVIPNTRVGIQHALVGGVAAGILFELAKLGYAWVATNLFQHHAIYGSLGTVPVFIIWVNITWVVVLFGCELTFANQNVGAFQQEEHARRASQHVRELVATRLMLEIAADHYRGARPSTAPTLGQRLFLPVRLVRDVAEYLSDARLVLEVAGDGGDGGLVPGRALSELTVGDVIRAMRRRKAKPLDVGDDERQAFLERLLEEAEQRAAEVYSERDLLSMAKHFVEREDGGDDEVVATEVGSAAR